MESIRLPGLAPVGHHGCVSNRPSPFLPNARGSYADGVKRETLSRLILALFYLTAGVNHFLNPGPYLAMMPPAQPHPEVLHLIAGAAEAAGGAGILIPAMRRAAAWGLILLLVMVFPANLQVALHGWPGIQLPPWVLWARLLLQPLLIWWVYRACLGRPPESA